MAVDSVLALSECVVAMDRLPSDKQELLRKSITERLRLKLAQIGWDEEKVLALDRTELLEAAAEVTLGMEQLVAAAKESLPMDGGSTGSNPASSAARMRELEMEERRKEREERERKAERILEQKKLETNQRKLELELQERRLAREAEVKKMEYELRKLELIRRTDRYERQEGEEGENMELEWRAAGHPQQDTLAGRTKIFGDAMRHVLPKMPSESAKIPNFSKRSKSFS